MKLLVIKRKILLFGSIAACALAPQQALAQAASAARLSVEERLDLLEKENAELRAQVSGLQTNHASQSLPVPVAAPVAVAAAPETASQPARAAIGFDQAYSEAILDHTQNVNQRRIVQLQARAEGRLNNTLTLSGEVIAIANAHWSNRVNKFGYLMRHPTGNNQRTKATQEITINSVQIGLTAAPVKGVTGYVELLYDPEQSFAAGTLIALERNQVQVRKAYVLFGDLDRMPFYAAAGKLDVAFGLQDTVSPFTNSSNWHAFAPLAFGGEIGYYRNGLSLRATAIQGGAQFRAANTPVDGTAIPSKLNNFAFDGNYTLAFGDANSVMLGGSYLHGSAYCQNYPIFHFNPCKVVVPAWAAYGRARLGRFELIGEYATTTKVWPGTKVPDPTNPLSAFAASEAAAFTLGGRYEMGDKRANTRFSLEYSKFLAGPQGSPWHRQDQTVLGVSRQFAPGVSVFGEAINVRGFVPLNFISGGNFPDGSTWCDSTAKSQVLMLGAKITF